MQKTDVADASDVLADPPNAAPATVSYAGAYTEGNLSLVLTQTNQPSGSMLSGTVTYNTTTFSAGGFVDATNRAYLWVWGNSVAVAGRATNTGSGVVRVGIVGTDSSNRITPSAIAISQSISSRCSGRTDTLEKFRAWTGSGNDSVRDEIFAVTLESGPGNVARFCNSLWLAYNSADYALLSAAIYNLTGANIMGPSGDTWSLIGFMDTTTGTELVGHQVNLAGYRAALYLNERTRTRAIVFKGSDNAEDFLQDGFDVTSRLTEAMSWMAFVDRIQSPYIGNLRGNSNFIVTGHSLGGAMAYYVAERYGLKAFTFNAINVPPLTVSYFNTQNPSIDYNPINITNLFVQGETLSNTPGVRRIGGRYSQYEIPTRQSRSILGDHSISDFSNKLKIMREFYDAIAIAPESTPTAPIRLAVGNTRRLSLNYLIDGTPLPAADAVSLRWRSSDSNKVSVSATGVITALAESTTPISIGVYRDDRPTLALAMSYVVISPNADCQTVCTCTYGGIAQTVEWGITIGTNHGTWCSITTEHPSTSPLPIMVSYGTSCSDIRSNPPGMWWCEQ